MQKKSAKTGLVSRPDQLCKLCRPCGCLVWPKNCLIWLGTEFQKGLFFRTKYQWICKYPCSALSELVSIHCLFGTILSSCEYNILSSRIHCIYACNCQSFKSYVLATKKGFLQIKFDPGFALPCFDYLESIDGPLCFAMFWLFACKLKTIQPSICLGSSFDRRF